jgi:cell division protein FtsQ
MKKTAYILFLLPLSIISTLTVIYLCSSGQRLFLLKNVKIKGVEQMTDGDVMGRACPFLRDGSIFGIDVEQLKAAVGKHPFVKEVRVKRVFPFSLVIDVREKKPSALWVSAEGNVQVLDEEGLPFRGLKKENTKGLVMITAPDKQDAQKAFKIFKTWANEGIVNRGGVEEITYNQGNMAIMADEAVEVVLGKEDQKERLKRAFAVLEDAKKRGLFIRCIDARFEKGAIVKERTG